jgi:formylglycine-generating enzyme required for sulfatase activity
MSGNLREFCWDSSIRSDYSQGYTIRPTSSTSSFPRIARGGDWSSDAATCRCSYRSTFFPDTGKGNYLGFRPARGKIN